MAKEVKHTPGPWIVVEANRGSKKAAAWICNVGNNPRDPAVFSTVLDGDKFVFGDKVADARLIAAAPDLLEQLKLARSVMRSQAIMLGIIGASDDGNVPLLADIDAAIARAEAQP